MSTYDQPAPGTAPAWGSAPVPGEPQPYPHTQVVPVQPADGETPPPAYGYAAAPPPPAYGYAAYGAPATGYQYVAQPVPMYRGERVSARSRTVAALLSFFLGMLGVDRFYLGNTGMGVAKLLLGWATLGIWPLIDFIVIVAGGAHDGEGARVTRWE